MIDDDGEWFPEPWEVATNESCCCALMLTLCDATDPWCLWHADWRAALRRNREPERVGEGHEAAGD